MCSTHTKMHTRKPIPIIYLLTTATLSQARKRYETGIVDDFKLKSDVLFPERISEVSSAVRKYMARAERVAGHRLQNIRIDGAGEHSRELIRSINKLIVVRILVLPYPWFLNKWNFQTVYEAPRSSHP